MAKGYTKDYVGVVPFPDTVELRPIGIVRSPYTERWGTPRQARVPEAAPHAAPREGRVELFPDVVPPIALKDLDGFDYAWLICWLHLNKGWNPTVRPPRGPAVKRGLLATRAPHRPNQLGLSAVQVVGVEGHVLHVRGLDILDGTPVLDIKPYVPYCDAFPDASAGWVDALDAAGKQGEGE